MKKQTVQSVKNSLKFKADEKPGILSVRVGVKKYTLPIKARMLSGGDFLFLSFPASSELYKVGNEGLEALNRDADPGDAYSALNPGRRKGRRKGASGVELPHELATALKAIPDGMKLGYGPDGTPRLVRTRSRRSGKDGE
ncbi:MAG TPA: hypothetical protein VGE01_04770 [Fimbriimonas sp.]